MLDRGTGCWTQGHRLLDRGHRLLDRGTVAGHRHRLLDRGTDC